MNINEIKKRIEALPDGHGLYHPDDSDGRLTETDIYIDDLKALAADHSRANDE